MEMFELTLSFLSSIAWPLVLLVAAFIIKRGFIKKGGK